MIIVRFFLIYLMCAKSETSSLVKSYVSFIKNLFSKTVKTIRTDNDLEFILKYFYMQHGIHHRTSCVGTPQQNDIIEQKHQHLLGVPRALLFQAKLFKKWAYASSHACFLNY